jgi:universal stress protein A
VEAIMPTVRSILCPVDFSEQSRQALRWASAIAQYRGARLTVLSVVEPLLAQAAGIRLGVDLAREDVQPALKEFVEATLPDDVRQATHVRMEVTIGEPSEAILQAGHRVNPELIVMGTHGLGGLRKFVFGSTTEQVLRGTEWRLLAVPAAAAAGAPEVGDPGVRLKKILVATDFGEGAMAAVRWAVALAADVGVPLVLAHVVEPIEVPLRWQAFATEFEGDRVESAQRMLASLSENLRDDTRIECVVSVGRPAETIASIAVEHGAGLVVMGLSNADGSESEWRIPGSLAYRVLRIAPHVSLVVVPAPRMRQPSSN